MKTTIDKEFFEKWKDKEVAMWCKKKEYAEEFCRLMHVQGLRWSSERSYLDRNNWSINTTETSYSFNIGGFSDREWHKNNEYTVLDFEDYIVKEKMTKQELVELMIDNFTNEYGMLDLSHLDFTKFDCSVNISSMEVARNLVQEYQKVQGNLYQMYQEVQGEIFQERVENKFISNEPSHYSIDGIDTMNLILTICEHNNTNQRETFYLANTLKYLIRYKNKNGIEDLNKAKDYLDRLIDQVTKEENFYNVDGQGD